MDPQQLAPLELVATPCNMFPVFVTLARALFLLTVSASLSLRQRSSLPCLLLRGNAVRRMRHNDVVSQRPAFCCREFVMRCGADALSARPESLLLLHIMEALRVTTCITWASSAWG